MGLKVKGGWRKVEGRLTVLREWVVPLSRRQQLGTCVYVRVWVLLATCGCCCVLQEGGAWLLTEVWSR